MRISDWSSDVCSSDLLACYMRGFDLLLSYNWGAMDGVMAHRLHRKSIPARLIHHEDGFNEDESVRRNWKRNLFRRLALRGGASVVVPSTVLQRIAADEWKVGDRTDRKSTRLNSSH